ncbi:hypothetical protein CSAL01_13497 [Colletotrichum salicis]|uniref:Ubiquitin-like protease family profile domain-containing protein n=1 Tax=Colletotrichum salicis TaxID=1209931 RepID=A0A135TQD2_9PEZI|nr:hypothetical protein CSAL01_13497 [Colletotrichum salicis]
MPQEEGVLDEICQILCLSSDGYEPVTCQKRGDFADTAQRIWTRFDHIRAVRSNNSELLRVVNTLYRLLFTNETFHSDRFSSALKRSRQCDWVCCEGPDSDQNTTAGRRAAAQAWSVSEGCLVTFFGNDISGNTWREIGAFARKARDWERAQVALFAARDKRLRESKVNKRLSQKKSWTPYDQTTALKLYDAGGTSVDQPGWDQDGDRVDHAHHRPGASRDASVGTAQSADRIIASPTALGNRGTSEAVIETILVSSQSHSHGSSGQSSRSKRPQSVGSEPIRPVPKRQMNPNDADEVQHTVNLSSLEALRSGSALSFIIVFAALHIIECAHGERVEIVDPATAQAFSRPVGPSARLMIPLLHGNHWALGVKEAGQNVLRVYDSQPSLANRHAVKEIVAGMSMPLALPDIKFTAPLLQDKEEDSGLLLVIAALFISLDLPVPQDADTSFWREVLYILLMPLSVDETDFIHKRMTEEPLPLQSKYERITIPGESICVGNIPTALTPLELLGLLEKLHIEVSAVQNRVELITSCASSASAIATGHKNSAKKRCLLDIKTIGEDVIGSLVRFNRLEKACQGVSEDAFAMRLTLSRISDSLTIGENPS